MMNINSKMSQINSAIGEKTSSGESLGSTLNKITTGTITGDNSHLKAKNKGELNKEDFMKLLVAELQNQNPLEPKSNQEMGSSLAQFSQLDQLESMNSNIAKMVKADDPANKLYSASLIGKSVKTESVNIDHEKGKVSELSFQIPSPASKVEINILDNTGTEIKNITLDAQNAGLNHYKWDGRDSSGDYAQSGKYTYEVKATSEHGASLKVARGVRGVVDSVEYSDDKVSLLLDNGNQIRLEDVKSVNNAYKGQSIND